MIKVLRLGIAAFLVAMPLIFAAAPAAVAFNPVETSCEGPAADSPVCRDAANTQDPVSGSDGIIAKIANILAFVAGVIGVIIIIIAGITMMTSQGDPGKVKSSRDTIIYTAVGIIVIVMARAIVLFIVNEVG